MLSENQNENKMLFLDFWNTVTYCCQFIYFPGFWKPTNKSYGKNTFHKKQLFSQKNQKIAQNCKKWAKFGVL